MRRLGLILGCAGIALAAFAPGAGAATITVNVPSDDDSGGEMDLNDVGCSLREAVQSANTNTAVSLCTPQGGFTGADTILLQGGSTFLLSKHAVDDTNAMGDLDFIDGQTTIRATGTGLATINADSNTSPGPPIADIDRAIHVLPTAGSVTLERVKVILGRTTSPTGGGGIAAERPVTVIDSEISDNSVASTSASNSRGGGISVRSPQGSLTMTGSTVTNNVAASVSAVNASAVGGGIATPNTGSSVSVTITNSTISGNTAAGDGGLSGVVGGLFTGAPAAPGTQAVTSLTNVTITGNSATGNNGVVGGFQSPNATVTGVLSAGNTDTGMGASDFPDCGIDPAISGGGNLIGERGADGACDNLTGAGDLVGLDGSPIVPALGNLIINPPGLTRTHLLNPGSPAIDRGGTCSATDQRGLFRFAAAPCDAGSVEIGASTTPPPVVQVPQPIVAPPGATGQRAAALAKCKKKKSKKARRKCRARANKLPV